MGQNSHPPLPSQTGGIFRFFLDDIPERLKLYNTKRCKHAEMGFCLCGNAGAFSGVDLAVETLTRARVPAAPPPPFMIPPPPPTTYSEDWTPAGLEPSTSAFRGRVAAFYKRAVLGRMINPSLRASAHSVACPNDDCADKCMRSCAGYHLNDLRAVSVTGETWVKERPPPPSSPPPRPPPPMPPFAPFSSCQDTCTLGPLFDYEEAECRDGGKVSKVKLDDVVPPSRFPILCNDFLPHFTWQVWLVGILKAVPDV